MTRRVPKFDLKMPTSIPLPKRPSSRVDLETRLRKIDQQFQQDQDFTPSSSSTFMISNLKQELSHIKQDVEKLMMDDDYDQRPLKPQGNVGMKQESVYSYQKQIQEQLRKEIKELRMQAGETKARGEDRTGYLMKEIEVLKREQDVLFKEKEQALDTVAKLRKQLASSRASEGLQTQLLELKRKHERQRQQKQELQRTKKLLQFQNSKLTTELSLKQRQKEQFEGSASGWKEERNRMENEISRLKVAVVNAENNPEWKEERVKFDNEIERLKMQVATSISGSEWKVEKARLESEIVKFKQMTGSSEEHWKEEKGRLENEILRLQMESKKSKELLDGKYKSNKEQMVSSINSIKELTEKNYEFVRKINNLESDLTQKSSELRKKEQLVLQQKQQIKIINKEKDTRYTNLMSEFKKLEETLNKSAQENMIGMKNSIFSLENSLKAEQSDKEKLRVTIADLSQKLERMSWNYAEEKKQKEELEERMRQEVKSSQEKEIKIEKRMSIRVDELESELVMKKKDVSSRENLMESYLSQIKELQNYKANQEKLKVIQMQNLNNSFEAGQLITEITNLKQTIQTLEVELFEKNRAIQRLSQANQQSSTSTEIEKVESKYKQIVEELNQTVQQNEMIILRLENEVNELKEANKRVKADNTKNSSFDDIFKDQIRQNEELKLSLKNKTEQIFSLKNTIDDLKRKIDYQKNQSEIERLKTISDEKKIKNHYQIQIQNITSEADSQKRKYQALQARLDGKIDQLKKKDTFIQNVIISKAGKNTQESELEYITKQVGKFFNVNYGDKLIVAEQQIRVLKQKLRGY